MCTLFCLVGTKKRSFLTLWRCVFWFVFLNASNHLCFRFFLIPGSADNHQWVMMMTNTMKGLPTRWSLKPVEVVMGTEVVMTLLGWMAAPPGWPCPVCTSINWPCSFRINSVPWGKTVFCEIHNHKKVKTMSRSVIITLTSRGNSSHTNSVLQYYY